MSLLKGQKAIASQRVFDFVQECCAPPAVTPAPCEKKKKQHRSRRTTTETLAGDRDLADLCVLLHDLAKKHVATSNFQDFNLRVRCTKLLETLGVIGRAAEHCALANDHDTTIVLRSPPYRRLRAHVVACLATVADLSTRAPGKGTPEYQRGMREAFQQAGDIAALFLDEVEQQYRLR